MSVIARILFISDLHKRYADSAAIHGQIAATNLIQEDLIAINKKLGITHDILLGDWYHRGFHGLCEAFGAIQQDRKLADSVNGNVYLTIGNHFYLERDSNPEMYVIQPNEFLHPHAEITMPDKPIFRVVNQLMVGTVQIDFFHYTKVNKSYSRVRNPETTYHIGVYHDDCCVPGWVREQEGYTTGTVSQQYLNQIYGNIDLGICGHIHTSAGLVKLDLMSGRQVPLLIPGALGITQSTENQKHPFVNLPIVEVNDDGTVTLKQIKVSTHMEQLVFLNKKSYMADSNPLKAAATVSKYESTMVTNLSQYLCEKGYSGVSLKIIKAASKTGMELSDVIDMIQEENTVNGNSGIIEEASGEVH